MEQRQESQLENYEGELLVVIGEITVTEYAGQNDFFGKYNNFVSLDNNLSFHLRSQSIEMFCKGDVVKIIYPKLYSKKNKYIPTVSHEVLSKGTCGHIDVKIN